MRTKLTMAKIMIIILSLFLLLQISYGSQYRVGDSIWSIPPTNNFYTNWSSSYSFQIGDTLYFDFNSGFYNVIEVSSSEYESCTSNQSFREFIDGPVVFSLTNKGLFYFICNVSNYCKLGVKVSVTVGPKVVDANPTPPPSLAHSPYSSQAPLPNGV